MLTAWGPVEVRLAGAGTPVLVVHGTPGGADAALLAGEETLGEGFRWIAPSRPGYLKTPIISGRTAEEQADLLAALLPAVGVDRAVVFAFSGGGPAALALAARHPEQCRALLLCAVVSERETVGRWDKLVEELAWSSDLYSWWVAPLLPDRGVPRFLRVLTPVASRKEGWRNDGVMFAGLGELGVEKIGAPTLIAHGSKDEAVPVASSERLAKRIPGARLLRVEGVGHLGLMGRAEVKAALREFALGQ